MAEEPIVFPFEPDWSEPFRERLAWLTDVQPSAEEAAEQRIALRALERTELRYRALATQAREAAALRSLLYGAGGKLLAVPFWPDALRITASLSPGATDIPLLTTIGRRLQAGALALLWRDPHTWEKIEIALTRETYVFDSGFLEPSVITQSNAAPFGGSDQWLNPANAGASDDARATVSLSAAETAYALYLRGFSLPAELAQAIEITGFEVEVEGFRTLVSAGSTAIGLFLLKEDGAWFSPANKNFVLPEGPSDSVTVQGGPADKWGLASIPAATFTGNWGIVLQASVQSGAADFAIDRVRFRLYFTLLSPLVRAAAGLAGTWPQGSYIVPLLRARLEPPATRPLTAAMEEAEELRFLCETEELLGTRIQTSGGSGTIKYFLTVANPSVAGVSYEFSVRVTNVGSKNVLIGNNFGVSVTVAPGETRTVLLTAAGDGVTLAALLFLADNAGDALDCIAFAPSVRRLDTEEELVADADLDFQGAWAANGGASITLTQNVNTGLVR